MAAVAAAKAVSVAPTVRVRATVVAAAAMAAVVATVVAATAATEPRQLFLSKGPSGAFFMVGWIWLQWLAAQRPTGGYRPYCTSVWRRLRGRPANTLSKRGLGSMRSSLATTPICQGITR